MPYGNPCQIHVASGFNGGIGAGGLGGPIRDSWTGEDGTPLCGPGSGKRKRFCKKKREDLERRQQELLSLIGQKDITADGPQDPALCQLWETDRILRTPFAAGRRESDCSAASFYIWAGRIFRGRREQFSAYRDAALPDAGKGSHYPGLWILEPISRPLISASARRRIRRWDTGRSGFA